jgi:hypothetical protein
MTMGRRRANGSVSVVWRVRWHDESGSERNKTFDCLADARVFEAKIRTLKRMGDLALLDAGTETLSEFWQEWWALHAEPNLERATRRLYARMWRVNVEPRLGSAGASRSRGGRDHYRSSRVMRAVRGDARREPAAVLRGL